MKLVFVISVVILHGALLAESQRQPRPHRNNPLQSFQFLGSLSGFSATSSPAADISSQLASQLVSGAQDQAHLNEVPDTVARLPLYKQSYPGLYVKGHAPESFKYEPTRQVAHHHGPNYQIPRSIASSSAEQRFGIGGSLS